MALVLMLSMVLSVASINVWATEGTPLFLGSGTEADPYLISTSADLIALANETNKPAADTEYEDKYYKITQDINMSGVTGFYGIGRKESVTTSEGTTTYGYTSANTNFKGTIDGDGHIISDLTIDRTNNTGANGIAALVVWPSGATIKNLGMYNVTSKGGSGSNSHVGAFAGRGKVTIENCFLKGTVTLTAQKTSYKTGGFIAAYDSGSVVKNSYILPNGIAIASMNGSGKTITYTNVYWKANASSMPSGSTNVFSIQSGRYWATDASYETKTVDVTSLSAFATASNGAFEADIYEINNDYPVLAWENDFLSGGSGTEADPYLLATAEDLVTLSELTNKNTDAYNAFDSAYYKLTADIDMAGIEGFLGISPMRNEETGAFSNTGSFKGVLDGNYHTISNMTANASNAAGYSALVPYAGGCTIKNLGLINPVLTGDTRAGFACCRMGGATIDGCFVKGLAYISSSETQYAFTAYKNANIRITNSYCTDNGIGAYQGDSGTLAAEISNVFTWNGGISTYANVYNNNLNSVDDNRSVEKTNAFIAASNGAFEKPNGVDSTKPVLWWENTGVYMEMDHAEQAVSLENRQHIIPNGVLIVAAYTSAEEMQEVVYFKNLSELSIGEYDTVTVNYDLADGATRYKAFVWSSLDELVPLCASEAYPPAA